MLRPIIRFTARVVGGAMIAATIYFLPSFEREFFMENKDILGAIAFPLLTMSTGFLLLVAENNGRLRKGSALLLAFSALLLAAWYIRAFIG